MVLWQSDFLSCIRSSFWGKVFGCGSMLYYSLFYRGGLSFYYGFSAILTSYIHKENQDSISRDDYFAASVYGKTGNDAFYDGNIDAAFDDGNPWREAFR